MKRTKQPSVEKKIGPFIAPPDSPITSRRVQSKELSTFVPYNSGQKTNAFLKIMKILNCPKGFEVSSLDFDKEERNAIREILSLHITQKILPILPNESLQSLNMEKTIPQTSTAHFFIQFNTYFNSSIPYQALQPFFKGMQEIINIIPALLSIIHKGGSYTVQEELVKSLNNLPNEEKIHFFSTCATYGFELLLQKIVNHNSSSLKWSPEIPILRTYFEVEQANALKALEQLYVVMLKNNDQNCIKIFNVLIVNEMTQQNNNAPIDTYKQFVNSLFVFIKEGLVPLAQSLNAEEDLIKSLQQELGTDTASKICLANEVSTSPPAEAQSNAFLQEEFDTIKEGLSKVKERIGYLTNKSEISHKEASDGISLAEEMAQLGINPFISST